MSGKAAVVTGQITINGGGSFLLTAANGSIADRRAQGLFVRDTRLILLSGVRWSERSDSLDYLQFRTVTMVGNCAT